MPPEERLKRTRAVFEHEAVAVPPQPDGAAQQWDHPPGQNRITAINRILRVAEEMSTMPTSA